MREGSRSPLAQKKHFQRRLASTFETAGPWVKIPMIALGVALATLQSAAGYYE